MKRIAYIIASVIASAILIGSVFGATIELDQSDFPYTYTSHSGDVWDTLSLTESVSTTSGLSTGGGLYISVDNVVVLGNNDTITFNTNNQSGTSTNVGSSVSALFISGDNIAVYDLTVIQYSDTAAWNIGLRISAVNNVRLYDCNIHVKGPNSKNVFSTSSFYNIELSGGNYTSYCRAFNSRCQNDGAAIYLRTSTDADDTAAYNVYIHNITIDSCPNWAVTVRGTAFVDSNTIYLNSINEYFPVDESCGVCEGTGNSYAISIGGCRAGTAVRWNTIRVRSTFGGGRGIYADETTGTEANPIEIAYNDVDISEGPLCYGGESNEVYGLRARWGNHHLRVHNNRFVITVDTSTSTTHIGRHAIGMYITEGEGSRTGDSNYFYNNFVQVTATDADDQCTMYAMDIENNDYADTLLSIGNKSMYNYLDAPGFVMRLGGVNGGGSNWTSISDTFVYSTPHYTDKYRQTMIVGVGHYNNYCTTNVILDPIFLNGEDIDDVGLSSANTDSRRSFYASRTVRADVVDAFDSPIEGVLITAVSSTDDTVSGSTNTGGLCSLVVPIRYKSSTTGSWTTNVDYNDYIITAMYAGDTIVDTVTLSAGTPNVGSYVPLTMRFENYTLSDTIDIGDCGSPSSAVYLGIPRSHSGMLGDTIVTHWTANDVNWAYSYDGGVTWDSGGWIEKYDNHHASWMDALGFHTVMRPGSYATTNPGRYQRLASPYADNGDLISYVEVPSNYFTYMNDLYGNGTTIWISTQLYSAVNHLVYFSTDTGQTWDSVRVLDLGALADDDYRSGIVGNDSGYPCVSFFYHGICISCWDGTDWDSTQLVTEDVHLAQRMYTHIEVNNRSHAIYPKDIGGGVWLWRHGYEDLEGGLHEGDTICTISWDGVGGSSTPKLAASVHGTGDSAVLYMAFDYGSGGNHGIFVKWWTAGNGWSTDSIEVSAHTNTYWGHDMVRNIPSDNTQLPIFYEAGGNIYFRTLEIPAVYVGDPPGPPPVDVNKRVQLRR